ncbi:MAG: hypothetical protein JW942_00755 [Opitutales bacterium]|nr:hypothetical protein [Opitutales bacterium]
MEESKGQKRPFLGVYFESCGVYGRFYRNAEGSAYVGRCPRCGKPFKIRVGAEGTSSRFFVATCR